MCVSEAQLIGSASKLLASLLLLLLPPHTHLLVDSIIGSGCSAATVTACSHTAVNPLRKSRVYT